jgi:transposase InsO family protein
MQSRGVICVRRRVCPARRDEGHGRAGPLSQARAVTVGRVPACARWTLVFVGFAGRTCRGRAREAPLQAHDRLESHAPRRAERGRARLRCERAEQGVRDGRDVHRDARRMALPRPHFRPLRRRVVGWAAGHTNDRELALDALRRAMHARSSHAGLVHHSDRGSPLGFNGGPHPSSRGRNASVRRARFAP